MNIEELRDFCMTMEGVEEKTPFGKFAGRYDSILVFYILNHMFCLTDMDDFTSITVRSTPEELIELKMNHASASNPVNLSPKYWMQLNFNGDIKDMEIYNLIKRSYELVKEKYTGRPKKR